MRSLSIALTLLFPFANLPAQPATGNDPAKLIPPVLSSCPVRFSVDRRPYFATIWINSKVKEDQISLPNLERALKNEPGFGEMSPQAYRARLDRRVQADNTPRGEDFTVNFSWPQTRIVSADIIVHADPSSFPSATATPSRPRDMTEAFHLTARAGEPLLHSTLRTQRQGMTNWIELTRLDYADGTSWRSSVPGQCHAAPGPYPASGSPR